MSSTPRSPITAKRPRRLDPLAERVARLEAIAEAQAADMAAMQKTLQAVHDSLTRYKGFWGGVTVITGAVVTFLTMSWDTILTKMGFK